MSKKHSLDELNDMFEEVREKQGKEFLYGYNSADKDSQEINSRILKQMHKKMGRYNYVLEDLLDASWILPLRFVEVWSSNRSTERHKKWSSSEEKCFHYLGLRIKEHIHVKVEVLARLFPIWIGSNGREELECIIVTKGVVQLNENYGNRLFKAQFLDKFECQNSGLKPEYMVNMDKNSAFIAVFRFNENKQVIVHAYCN